MQRPGLVVPDTKLDLSVDPVRLLARGLHLWDPDGGAGQLQNQAYGYLFPMGPFFAVLQATGLPPWAVQRLWQALVLCVAFLGVRALAARLGLGTPGTRLLAAAAYALAPRPLSQLGAISVEVWPYALAPWVLVPLVTGATRGSPRRAAARSGAALLLVGGVNAAATLAVVPLGVLWLATRAPGPRRRALSAWWALAVVLACAWWLGPLLLLGRYSPPFLDVIEAASTTTGTTGLWSVLTGNDLWQQYLSVAGDPVRPAGSLLVTVPALVLCSTALAALGLAAVTRATTPHRGFLAGGVLLGVVVVGAGHVGALRLQAGLERDLLDGALAPFRNVHKYDLLLRLPLALGLASLTAVVQRPRVRPAVLRRPVAVLAGLALVGAASPLLQVQQRGAFVGLPGYWQETADFLEAAYEDAGGRALVVPAAPSGQYVWGSPGDEPLQPLARSPYVVRDAVPLGGPGTTRVLDAVDDALLTGRGSPALAPFLARAGVRHLVVRNDLDLRRTGSVRPLAVHASLAASPGLRRVAAFGPPVGAPLETGPLVVDAGLQPRYPAVEVFEVEGAAAPGQLVAALPRAGTQRVSGGPETVLPLLETGVLGPTTPARLAGEPALPGEQAEARTVTDGYRAREADFGRATDVRGATLGNDVRAQADRPVHDHLPVPLEGHATTAVPPTGPRVTASSSAADGTAVVARGRDRSPTAGADGRGSTRWVTGGLDPTGQWLQVADDAPLGLTAVVVRAADVPGSLLRPVRVRVELDGAGVSRPLRGPGPLEVPVPPGVRRVRVTVEQALSVFGTRGLGAVALELQLRRAVGGDLRLERPLQVPADAAVATGGRPAQGPVVVALDAGRRDAAGCLPLGTRAQCAGDLERGDEDDAALDRVVVLDRAATSTVSVGLRARPGRALEELLQRDQPGVRADASSRLVGDPAVRPAAAVDRDPATAWVAGASDPAPRLVLDFLRPQEVTGLQLVVDAYLAASRPLSVRVSARGSRQGEVVALDGAGRGVLRTPLTASGVVLSFPAVERRSSLDVDGLVRVLPVGVSEVRVDGPPDDALRQDLRLDRVVDLPCGQGPVLSVDGVPTVRTAVRAPLGALLELRPLQAVACEPLVLGPGPHRLTLSRTDLLQPTSLVLRAGAAPEAAAPRGTRVVRWGVADRRVRVAPGPESWLVVRENANPGWTATLDGRPLRAARLDGWQQAFVLPAGGAGEVRLVFAPDRPYRVSLLVGALLALALLVLAAVPGRPGPEAPAGRPARTWPVRVLTGGAVLLVAGPAGAVLLPLALLARRRLPLAWPSAGALLVAGAVVALRPWPAQALLGLPVELLGATALAGLAVSLWPPRAPGRAAAAPAPPPA